MSCVTKTTVLSSSRCSRMSSCCRSARTMGSTAPNGSSMSRMFGSAASPRATPTRCCWPPDSWLGYRLASDAIQPDGVEQLERLLAGLLLGHSAENRHGRDVVDHPEVRHEAGVLHDVADAAPQRDGIPLEDALAIDLDLAAGGLHHPVDHAQQSRLAAARRADEHGGPVRGDDEAEVLDGARAVGELLRDAGELDHRGNPISVTDSIPGMVVLCGSVAPAWIPSGECGFRRENSPQRVAWAGSPTAFRA